MELEGLLDKLKMETLQSQVDTLLEQAAKRDVGYREFLTDALKTEWHGRNLKTTEGRMRLARFPWIKTVEAFDFSFQPSIDRKVIRELSGLSFVARAENAIFLGPPGVGKTHLAIALGVKAVEAGNSALFLTVEELTTRLAKARASNRLEAVLAQLARPKLLVLDELGYLPFSREEASSLFRLLARRYEKGSVIITSNKSFADWERSFQTQFSPPRSSTGCSTTQPPSTSRGNLSGSRRSAGPACLGPSRSRKTRVRQPVNGHSMKRRSQNLQ
jgi:DNA replication protein DnaC